MNSSVLWLVPCVVANSTQIPSQELKGSQFLNCAKSNIFYLEMGSNSCQRGFGDKAQVSRSWCWGIGFRLKLLPNLMQVDFLLSKTQSFTVTLKCTQSWSDRWEYLYFAATMWYCLLCGLCVRIYLKSDNLHSQNLGVKMSGFVQIPNSEHQMVQMTDVNWTGTSEPDWWKSTENWLEVKPIII